MTQEDKIKLSKEQKQELIAKIKDYFLSERDEELGDLGAGILLDFILEKIAPVIYNQGIADAYKYLNDKLPDLFDLRRSE
jgi:uncharacterized protein (DUF2164 family)